METLILSLPLELKQFLDLKIAKGETTSYSDYILQKLVTDKERHEFLEHVKKHGLR